MARYWPDYLRSLGLWGKPKNEWPISVQRELTVAITPAWVVAECAWADDDDEKFLAAIEFKMQSLNND